MIQYMAKKMGPEEGNAIEEELEELATRHNEKKVFMNYDIGERVFENQEKIVKDCIKYEKTNFEKIKIHLRINYLLERVLPWDKE